MALVFDDALFGTERCSHQNANAVVMVPPIDFRFNTETSEDNAFQNKVSLGDTEIRRRAMSEFNTMVEELRFQGINALVMDYTPGEQDTPDAVFPNNWFSTHPNGDLYFYPMACPNRRMEIRPENLLSLFALNGFRTNRVMEVGNLADPIAFLESTGVMVMDHINRKVYAALSQRCDAELLHQWARLTGYQVVAFNTELSSGGPVYHTNVMMAVGERFAVICEDIIHPVDHAAVMAELSDKTVIAISEEQMGKFCGNVLQLENNVGEKFIAMSLSAFKAFTHEQKKQLSQHGTLMPFDVTTIETIGGGSVRCMLAELFLPKA
ncbi:arginine deiminase-related protein [Parasalinivibrio latis]|uniref:citrulline utilization hydrolase CtlX n=1 Tax=Parasalinivibrio latis TaxID=2952610 RepID=UPI0030E2394C